MHFATTLLAAAEEAHHGNVMAETVIAGIIAFVVFIALAVVTFSYRDVANRHAGKAEAYAHAQGTDLEHKAGHGH
ncbi:MAG: hypothetical protein DI573_13390 [Microbacterium sp.]|uniref:hypothetical protein n=1 Tax=unclassified Microbacterium TaxID=2609290 RepID=UPI000DB65862|nr:hypothetical protein [Microbacterium sp.]PZU36575.1 MAG: hypothetical protein DI573_13390 [Microbacterium sp.]